MSSNYTRQYAIKQRDDLVYEIRECAKKLHRLYQDCGELVYSDPDLHKSYEQLHSASDGVIRAFNKQAGFHR